MDFARQPHHIPFMTGKKLMSCLVNRVQFGKAKVKEKPPLHFVRTAAALSLLKAMDHWTDVLFFGSA
jgi:hypothetical protein